MYGFSSCKGEAVGGGSSLRDRGRLEGGGISPRRPHGWSMLVGLSLKMQPTHKHERVRMVVKHSPPRWAFIGDAANP